MAFNIFATATSDIPLANLDANFTLIGAAAAVSTLYPTATTSITYGTAGTTHNFSGSGVAVTGTLSATGVTTLGTANAVSNAALLNIKTADTSTAGAFASSALNVWNPTTVGTYSQITFGYNSIALTYAAAYFGLVSTNTTGGGYGDLVFGVRAVGTDTQATERARISSTGLAVTGTLGVSGQVSNYDSTAGNLCGVASKSYTALGNTSSAVATLTFQTAYNLAIIEVEWVGTNASVTTFTYASVKRYIQTYASAIAVNTAIYTDVVSGGTVVFTASGNTVIVTVTNTCGNVVNAGLTVRVSTGGSNSAGQRDVAIAFT